MISAGKYELKISHLPKSVRAVVLGFFVFAVISGLLGAGLVILISIAALSGDHGDEWTVVSLKLFRLPLWFLCLTCLFALQYWGLRNRRKWSYYVLRLILLPDAVSQVFFGLRQKDWLSRLIDSPEMKEWFLDQSKQ